MIVKEIYDKLETFNDDDRATYAGALCKELSSVSMQTLREFQNNWDGSRPASEFFAEQAKEIKKCVVLEVSRTGEMIRKATNLEPITWETEIAA